MTTPHLLLQDSTTTPQLLLQDSIKRHVVCEECGLELDPAKLLRCTKCKMCCYCSRECQTRNWKQIHKRVCTTDVVLRPFVPVEMAIERALAKMPKMGKAPKDAFCYICHEGGGASGKLLRSCGCRGSRAGFVHADCLGEFAASREGAGDSHSAFTAWIQCTKCKQDFQGPLQLEMDRRCWRRHRSSPNHGLRYFVTRTLASKLGFAGEIDVANQLLDVASTVAGNDALVMDLKILRADILKKNEKNLEALELLQSILPEAKVDTANHHVYCQVMLLTADVLILLHRNQEAHDTAAEAMAIAKAKFGLDDPKTLMTVHTYAVACKELGFLEEANENLEENLETQTRLLGPEHPDTQMTRKMMSSLGFGVGLASAVSG